MPLIRPAARVLSTAASRATAQRGLPSLARGPSKRPIGAALALVSLIDAMLVVVFFLLGTFGQDAQARDVDRPLASNVTDLVDAPIVVVKDGAMWVNGRYVGSTDESQASSKVVRFEPLLAELKHQREISKLLRPNAPAPTAVVLDIEAKTPAAVVKSVYLTASRAGYPEVSLMVEKRPH
jgi:biopolymer transport protein ExbD